MILTCVQQPSAEPVTLDDVQGQLRIVDLSEESAPVERMIKACREQAETITRRALISQTHELVLDGFPAGRNPLDLPLPPLQSIVSIKYIDSDGIEQTLDPLSYRVISDSEPGYVMPLYGVYWPVTRDDLATVRVRFVAGYGPVAPETSNNVPEAINQWILINVANLYENRETVGVALNRFAMFDFTKTICDGLLESYRIHRL